MTLEEETILDLDEEVFAEIGKTVTLTTYGSKGYNDRGELESSTPSSSSIVVVPYNITTNRQSHQPFGNMEEGDIAVAIRYDQAVSIGDILTIDSIDWVVKEIQPNYLPGNVVTICLLTKSVDKIADYVVPEGD